MTSQAILAIGGAFAGTTGSMLTAFSVNRALTELHLAQRFLGVTVERLATSQSAIPIFTGTEQRFKSAEAYGSRLVWIGVALLAAGFILQALSVLAS
jgi:hypothetical protein